MQGIKSNLFLLQEEFDTPKKSIQSKEYDLKLNEDNYKLIIDIYEDPSINFSLKQTNKITDVYYIKNIYIWTNNKINECPKRIIWWYI